MNMLEQVVAAFVGRADVGHLGLLLWAGCASGFTWLVLRELAAANRRFDEFVREFARFNARYEGGD